ncbi:MAG: non-canonical purine NTP pyrophosphatase [Candidatus Nanoarchaeia archaeon]
MKLVLATGNPGKVTSAQYFVGDVDFTNEDLDLVEKGTTVYEISRNKVLQAYSFLRANGDVGALVEDSAFYTPNDLDISPGPFIKRFLREHRADEGGLGPFLRRVKEKGHPIKAYFRMVVTYFDCRLEHPIQFESRVMGPLIGERRGESKPFVKSPLAYIFQFDGQPGDESTHKTIAEMTEEEYKHYDDQTNWEEFGKWFGRNRWHVK